MSHTARRASNRLREHCSRIGGGDRSRSVSKGSPLSELAP